MGHLRSTNFTLGGSGWISFKLGGGKTNSTAYVSIRSSVDNTEVARFGNPNFNNSTISTAQYGSTPTDSEAFMYQYYFNLGSVATIGDSYYITLNEMSSYAWCILSADSIITYYPTAPTPGANMTATNIVPSILLAGSATASIPNGTFDTGDFTGWQNVNSSWYVVDGGTSNGHDGYEARSNPNGNQDLGVLRSSAFTIDSTYQYLRWQWGGGHTYDKQEYLSIREVGTNIEVMRIVTRSDLAGTNTENMDDAVANLTGLDQNKEYYLEFVDNADGSWGINYVDDVRLIDSTEWHSVVDTHPGDEVQYISPLETSFVYQDQTW
jgi:hypothetical protein